MHNNCDKGYRGQLSPINLGIVATASLAQSNWIWSLENIDRVALDIVALDIVALYVVLADESVDRLTQLYSSLAALTAPVEPFVYRFSKKER
jgi:hypothetical protein